MGVKNRVRAGRPEHVNPAREHVTRAHFDAVLDEFNREMGVKVAASMVKFHEAYMQPLEARIAELEALLAPEDAEESPAEAEGANEA